MLEPYEVKVSRTVLRGERESDLPDLPDLSIHIGAFLLGHKYIQEAIMEIILIKESGTNCYIIKKKDDWLLIDVGVNSEKLIEAINKKGLSFKNLKLIVITHAHSDHAPPLVNFAWHQDFGPCPFKFLDVWLEDEVCIQIIQQSWEQPVCDEGDMSFRWFLKLNQLKQALRVWNRDHFGNIFYKVKEAENRLSCVQGLLDDNFSVE